MSPVNKIAKLTIYSQSSHSSLRFRKRCAQAERFEHRNANDSSLYNANLSSRQLRTYCPLDDACQNLMKASVNEMGLSARAHDKILRVARTIADLDASDEIRHAHLSEAINYRILDRNLWH